MPLIPVACPPLPCKPRHVSGYEWGKLESDDPLFNRNINIFAIREVMFLKGKSEGQPKLI